MESKDIGRLETRTDVCSLLKELYSPLRAHRSEGNALIKPSVTGAAFPDIDASLEGFARPLWGLVPLAEGRGSFGDWSTIREGLCNGTNPDHHEYWGPVHRYSQKAVEMAPISFALATVPDQIWEPLTTEEQERIGDWLAEINHVELPKGNWLFFRVFVNTALRKVGMPYSDDQLEADLQYLDAFYDESGWYVDGESGHAGYYISWAFHYYGLIYSTIAPGDAHSECFRARARQFADDFRYWFADDGRAVPYGRSQIYRFAQGGFWGALAYADLDPLPWGVIRGLWQRHLQWWLDQPIFAEDGTLSLGYRYPTSKITEDYNSPSSPYWALKVFLPLALSDSHPFWQAKPAPNEGISAMKMQGTPGVITCRDIESDHVFHLASGQSNLALNGYPEKYNKFVYSSRYGFSVADSPYDLSSQAPDNTLLLTTDEESYHHRTSIEDQAILDKAVFTKWNSSSDVSVETWLIPAIPWHVRVHRLVTEHDLVSIEGGFPLQNKDSTEEAEAGLAMTSTESDYSMLRDATGDRNGSVISQSPNTNLLYPRTIVPLLRGEHRSGESRLGTVVRAGRSNVALTGERPSVEWTDYGFAVRSELGEIIFEDSNAFQTPWSGNR